MATEIGLVPMALVKGNAEIQAIPGLTIWL